MSGPHHSFTGPGGEEVQVGWDPDAATFWARVHHPTMPAQLAEEGLDPREYNPRDHPEVLVGARPFDVLRSDILAVRVRDAGYRIPAGIREDLAAYDDPARTLASTVRDVTQSAAQRLDRPGVSPQDHAEEQRRLHGAAREAAKNQYRVWGDPDLPDLTPEEVERLRGMLLDAVERQRLGEELRKSTEALKPKTAWDEYADQVDRDMDDYFDRMHGMPPDQEAGPDYGDEGPDRA